MSEAYEETDSLEFKQSLGATVLLACLRGISRMEQRQQIRASLREARHYEKRASQAANQAERQSNLMSAGQAYLNGRAPEKALVHFEAVRPGMEADKRGGTFYSFTGLANLYDKLAATYQLVNRPEDQASVQAQAVSLAAETEQYFGLRTSFHPLNGRLVRSVGAAPEPEPLPATPAAARQ